MWGKSRRCMMLDNTLINTKYKLVTRRETPPFKAATVLKSRGTVVQFNLNGSLSDLKINNSKYRLCKHIFLPALIFIISVSDCRKFFLVLDFRFPKRPFFHLSCEWCYGRTQEVWFLFVAKRNNSFVIILFFFRRERETIRHCIK